MSETNQETSQTNQANQANKSVTTNDSKATNGSNSSPSSDPTRIDVSIKKEHSETPHFLLLHRNPTGIITTAEIISRDVLLVVGAMTVEDYCRQHGVPSYSDIVLTLNRATGELITFKKS